MTEKKQNVSFVPTETLMKGALKLLKKDELVKTDAEKRREEAIQFILENLLDLKFAIRCHFCENSARMDEIPFTQQERKSYTFKNVVYTDKEGISMRFDFAISYKPSPRAKEYAALFLVTDKHTLPSIEKTEWMKREFEPYSPVYQFDVDKILLCTRQNLVLPKQLALRCYRDRGRGATCKFCKEKGTRGLISEQKQAEDTLAIATRIGISLKRYEHPNGSPTTAVCHFCVKEGCKCSSKCQCKPVRRRRLIKCQCQNGCKCQSIYLKPLLNPITLSPETSEREMYGRWKCSRHSHLCTTCERELPQAKRLDLNEHCSISCGFLDMKLLKIVCEFIAELAGSVSAKSFKFSDESKWEDKMIKTAISRWMQPEFKLSIFNEFGAIDMSVGNALLPMVFRRPQVIFLPSTGEEKEIKTAPSTQHKPMTKLENLTIVTCGECCGVGIPFRIPATTEPCSTCKGYKVVTAWKTPWPEPLAAAPKTVVSHSESTTVYSIK